MDRRVIFVHGLGGSQKTWGKFPELLEADDELGVKTYFLNFPTSLLGMKVSYFLQNKFQAIQDLAKALKTEIDDRHKDADEIVLVGHSMGGLIIRQFLLDELIAEKSPRSQKVVLYAVPNKGNKLSYISTFLTIYENPHLSQLNDNSDFLDLLNSAWTKSKLFMGNIVDFTVVVGGNDKIVTKDSAEGVFQHLAPKVIPDATHTNIIKPELNTDLAYIILKNAILKKKYLSEIREKIGGLDFINWQKYQPTRYFDFCITKERQLVFDSCTTEVQKLRSSIRIRGLSGLGKTRLVYEVVANLSTETQSKVVYIDVANGSPNLLQWLKHAIETGYEGILVVDNCSPTLHINLTDDVLRLDSKVSLITLDHNLEELSGPTKEFRLKPLTSDSIKQMLEPTFASKIKDLDRIAEFAQGFPQMAVLIAEARLANESDVGKLNNDELARKLIGDVTALELSILKACSLFDRFGFDAEVSDQYQFIAENIIGTPIADCIRCLRKFEKRGLIDLSGRYAQVVPKPLAVKLAAEWWSESTSESLSKLVDLVPDKLVKPFCTQITMLSFLPEVQQLTESLCGVSRPFGKAEVILSERGSLLFRSFVEVNPVVTVNSLYQVLTSQNFEQLQSIKDNVRRNLVWALEKLAYHSSAFEQAAWCLLLLASAENEDWSNNATGQFEQLFGVWLSGTEANFQLRLSVLKRAADLNDNLIDSLIVKAAAHAISTHSGTRTVGAEYQGNKPPLEEYRPKIWQEIFDYWDACMTALLNIVKKASPNSLNAQKIIGHSIRGLLSNGRIEMLENAIKNIIDLNGRYWPSALESVGNAVEYDAEAMPEEGKAALQKWHKMLQPDVADLRERLKIIVIDPPWEYKKVESGHYVDISAANAKNLAIELSASTVLDEQLLELLLNGQQTQTFVFGRQWAIESKNVNDLIENIILKITSSSNLNLNFLLGLLSGLHHVNPKAWESYLNRFANSSELVKYFPEILRTGKITPHHLAKFLELITSGILDSNSATSLSYGSVTAHLKSDTMSDFCTKLALHNEQSNWPALDVLFMYCFAEGKFEECSGALKFIVVNTPLEKKNRSRHSDIYHWKEVVDKFILIEDFEFCQSIFRQILSASKSKIDFDDLIHSVKPTLVKIFSLFGDQLWGELGDALLKAKGRELWGVSQLIERDNSFSIQNPSILNFISIPTLIKWCQSNIESGPYLLARSINIFDMNENDVKEPNPIFIALLENFGGLKNLGSEFTANLSSKGWSGSLVPYLQSDKAALAPLLNHENFEVRTWAKNHFEYVDKVITYESIRDDENQAGIY